MLRKALEVLASTALLHMAIVTGLGRSLRRRARRHKRQYEETMIRSWVACDGSSEPSSRRRALSARTADTCTAASRVGALCVQLENASTKCWKGRVVQGSKHHLDVPCPKSTECTRAARAARAAALAATLRTARARARFRPRALFNADATAIVSVRGCSGLRHATAISSARF